MAVDHPAPVNCEQCLACGTPDDLLKRELANADFVGTYCPDCDPLEDSDMARLWEEP